KPAWGGSNGRRDWSRASGGSMTLPMRRSTLLRTLGLLAAMLVGVPAAAQSLPSLDHDAALRLAAERNLSLVARKLERRRLELVAEGARRPYVPEVGTEAAAREIVGENRRAIEIFPSIT